MQTPLHITAKADYAVRACIELAAAEGLGPVRAEEIARAQAIPLRFLKNTLGDLRGGSIVFSRRGSEGGYWLARPAEQITLVDILRAAEGPIARVRGQRAEQIVYRGRAAPLEGVWVAVRVSLVSLLQTVTLAHLAAGELSDEVNAIIADPGVWLRD